MNYLFIGKMVDTHGIKGEVRIVLKDLYIYDIEENSFLKNLDVMDLLFRKNNYIYIGNDKKKFQINTYRHHKIYELLTFEGVTNINEVLLYKGQKCYIDQKVLGQNKIALASLIGFKVIWNNEDYGKIIDYRNNNGNIIFEVEKGKKYFIPINNNFIVKVDLENKFVIVKNIEGLLI